MVIPKQTELQLTDQPVFVLGAPRSGTSMMQWALRQHPDLWGGPESDFMVPLVEKLREIHDFGSRREDLHWLSGQKVSLDEFLEYMGLGLNALFTSRAGGLRWVEQTPQYTLHMGEILSLFPGARFVLMLRDGRDVVESLKNFVNPVEHIDAARLWARFAGVGLDFATGPRGDRVHVVRYQEAIEDTSETMARLFEFLGLPESADAVAWIRDRSPINSSFANQDRGRAVGRWLDWSQDDRIRFANEAGDVLIRAGFEPDNAWVTRA